MKALNIFCATVGLAMLVSCGSDSASSVNEENKSDEWSSDSNDLSSDSKKVENSSSSKEGNASSSSKERDVVSSDSHENGGNDDENGKEGADVGAKVCSDISVVEYSPEYESFNYECTNLEWDSINFIAPLDCDYEWLEQACNTDGERHYELKQVVYQKAHLHSSVIFRGDTLLMHDGHDAYDVFVGGCARNLMGTWIQLPPCKYRLTTDKINCNNDPQTGIKKLVFTDTSMMVYHIDLNPPPNHGAPEDPFNTDFMYNFIYLFRDNPAALVRPREVFQLTLRHGDTLKVYMQDHLVGEKTKDHALFNINGREVEVNVKEYSASGYSRIFSVDVSSNGSICSGYYEMSWDWRKYCKDEYAENLIWREYTELGTQNGVITGTYPLEPRPIRWAMYYSDDKTTDFEKCMKDMRAAE